MNLNPDAIFGQLRPLLRLAGAVIGLAAVLELFGARVGVPGGITEQALCALVLMHI